MKPYLFTSHMLGWKGFFDDDIFYNSILQISYLSAGAYRRIAGTVPGDLQKKMC